MMVQLFPKALVSDNFSPESAYTFSLPQIIAIKILENFMKDSFVF